LIRALISNPGLKSGTSISVGTSADTITLNGFVSSAAQKKLALAVARKQAPKYKILNQLVVKPPATRPS
jgi:osmotically-inducible protein OsmY